MSGRLIRANNSEFNAQFKYADNYIRTSKYTLLTFLPLNLFEQFRRLANFYFLTLLGLQLCPVISSLTPITTAVPLIVVLLITGVKNVHDDIYRHRSDRQVNNRESKLLRNGKLVDEPWHKVKVGDVICIENDKFVAADLMILSTSEPNGFCFVETAELDGETNLKCRQCLPETAALGDSIALLSEFDGEICCECPNNNLTKFEGTLNWKGKQYSIDNDKMLLRGCVLRNTKWCFGLVVFAGRDSKLMQNSGETIFKRTKCDKLLNVLIIGIALALIAICFFASICCLIWEVKVGQHFTVFLPAHGSTRTGSYSSASLSQLPAASHHRYPHSSGLSSSNYDSSSAHLGGSMQAATLSQASASSLSSSSSPTQSSNTSTAMVAASLVFFSYLIVLNTVVPISLYVSVEVIRYCQSLLIDFDKKMFYKPKNAFAKARTTTLNEELGQVEYVFSDKTGTLTKNLMTFNKCSINGKLFGDIIDKQTGDTIEINADNEHLFEPIDFSITNPNYYEPKFKFYDKSLLDSVVEKNKDDSVHEFFTLLALCHTVMSEVKADGKLEYQAQSPDEAALSSAARNFGFVFKTRTANSIEIEVLGEKKTYELLAILDFNNVRKRMSVIVREQQQLDDNNNSSIGKLILYCKGADSVILERVDTKSSESLKVLHEATSLHLDRFASVGLRTLCLAKKELSEKEFSDWQVQQHLASVALEDREAKLDACFEEIEKNLILIGATAIEDQLQDGVPRTIANILAADIKLWVLTGDKQETAINIGFSCELLSDDMADIFVVDGAYPEQVERQLRKCQRRIARFLSSRHYQKQRQSVNHHQSYNSDSLRRQTQSSLSSRPTQSIGTRKGVSSRVGASASLSPDPNNNILDTNNTGNWLTNNDNGGNLPTGSDGFALVISGQSLAHALCQNRELLLLSVACECKSVICCRVTPLQKALVVDLVKRHKKAVTLSIGDGANDVSMLKMAHIGVGISGQEGMQAVLASDYAIAQFMYLERLLLVHGRWSYFRMCKFLRYFFYKNFAFTLCNLWYAFFCGFSAQVSLTSLN